MAVLAIAKNDYADEFDCQCFKVFETQTEYTNWLREVEKVFEDQGEIEFYFGTNEFLEFSTFTDFQRNIRVKDISVEEYYAIFNGFGDTFGTGNIFEIELLAEDD